MCDWIILLFLPSSVDWLVRLISNSISYGCSAYYNSKVSSLRLKMSCSVVKGSCDSLSFIMYTRPKAPFPSPLTTSKSLMLFLPGLCDFLIGVLSVSSSWFCVARERCSLSSDNSAEVLFYLIYLMCWHMGHTMWMGVYYGVLLYSDWLVEAYRLFLAFFDGGTQGSSSRFHWRCRWYPCDCNCW